MYQLGIKPSGQGISAALERESRRVNVAIPGEIYKVDFQFQVWSMRKFAQFNTALLSTLDFVTHGLEGCMQRIPIKDQSLKISSGVFISDVELKEMIGQVKIKKERKGYVVSNEALRFAKKVQELGVLSQKQKQEDEETRKQQKEQEELGEVQNKPKPNQNKKRRKHRREQDTDEGDLDNPNQEIAPVPVAPVE
jgi:hypothetical protein